MPKLPLVALGLLALAGLLAATPALAGEAPQPASAPAGAPSLCFGNSSVGSPAGSPAAVEAPAPPALILFPCGDCSDWLCHGKNAGSTCGAGPAYQGVRCLNDTTCSSGGYTCTCSLA
jgi:hypothetical protein